ncbi:hypothetical protein Bpla01_68550 [Burkholderia plantarii]|nr:hypothetical protein Bpla01_68550 [Burkholderia plantarii]
MRGRASGAIIRATSSSEKPGRAAERDQGRLLQQAGIELPAQSAARRRRTQTMLDAMFQPFEDRLVDMIPGAVSHRVNSGVPVIVRYGTLTIKPDANGAPLEC